MTSEFWTFSLSRYDRAGVPELCLALQDRFGADVNIVLFMLWAGRSGRRINADQALARIQDAVGPWHREVVMPLRAVRRRMKGWPTNEPNSTEALHKRLNRIEIETERLEQEMLYALTQPAPNGLWTETTDQNQAMIENARDYLRRISAPPREAQALIAQLAALCY